MKNNPKKQENAPNVWIPTAINIGKTLSKNDIKYAIFGAGALAANNIMIRSTIDIDIVVEDYDNACTIMNESEGLVESNLQKDPDKIQVADFFYKNGACIEIWKNNIYSLKMDEIAWSRVLQKYIEGYDTPLRTICVEDLIVSKIGRYYQEKNDSGYEAKKNIMDILYSMGTPERLDYKYAIKRLKDGARRESLRANAAVHRLDWYFIREIDAYRIYSIDAFKDKIQKFISKIIIEGQSRFIEYYLLNELRKNKSWKKFQKRFMLEEKDKNKLQIKWKKVISSNKKEIKLNSKTINDYVNKIEPNERSDYEKELIGEI